MKSGRKSIFAQRMQKEKEKKRTNEPESGTVNSSSIHVFGPTSSIVSGPDADTIHQENVARLSSMSHDEIIEEQKKLFAEMDPSLIEFLKNRRSHTQNNSVIEPIQMDTDCASMQVNETPLELDDVKTFVHKYPHMDIVEKDKLTWIGEMPPPKPPLPDEPYQARFDFEGKLLPYSDDGTGVKVGLHNHGEEQERPGYTIQELMQLSRSAVLKQRLVALNTLGHIMANAFNYDKCFSEPLIPKLLEADMYLMLRFSLDDESNSVVMASAVAICNLFVNHVDEACLDRMLGSPFGNQQPSLGVILEMKPSDIAELKDVELLRLDIIRGALRTDLLSRLRYILECLNPEPVDIKHILKLLIRIVRHSYDSTEAVFSSPRLLSLCRGLLEKPIGNSYFPEALKLFRVISMRSRTLACGVLDHYSILPVIMRFITGEVKEKHPELMHLTLESFYTWQVFFTYNLAFDSIREMSPVLFRLAQAHLNLGQLEGCPMSDLEHATALLTTIYPVAKSDPQYLAPIAPVLHDMASMYISRFCSLQTISLSICKLIGAVLRLASLGNSLTNFLNVNFNLNGLVKSMMTTKAVSLAFQSLRFSSWLLRGELAEPIENLPCLGSIPPSLKDSSSVPLLFCLASYILSSDDKKLMKEFCTNEALISYIQDIMSTQNVKKMCTHWYARQELIFLVTVASIYAQSEDISNQEVYHTLSFQLLSLVQSGDKQFLPNLMSNCVFNKKYFSLDVTQLDEKMNRLSMTSCTSKICWSLKKTLVENALNIFDDIESYYMVELGLIGRTITGPPQTLTGQLNSSEPALPSDWPFLPILRLHGSDNVKQADLDKAKLCLLWILLLEEFKPSIAQCVDVTAKFCRVCCVFMTGNDFFRDVIDILEVILEKFLVQSNSLNLDQEILGLSSFYDFYRQLLEQFAAVSYCDPVFGQFVLVPLQQKHDPKYKKLLWSEMGSVLRLLSTPEEKVQMELYMSPCENDPDLLCSYLHALGTGKVRKEWCPVLYTVGYHHVCCYISNNDDRLSRILLDRINKMGNLELKDAILNAIRK